MTLQKIKEQTRAVCLVALRFIVRFIAIVIVAWLAMESHKLGGGLRDWITKNDAFPVDILPPLTVATILTVVKNALNLLPALLKIREKEFMPLWSPTIAICLSFFMLGMANINWPSKSTQEPPETTPVTVLNFDGFGSYQLNEQDKALATFFVTFKQEAKKRDINGKFQYGVNVSGSSEEFLEDLAKALSKCNSTHGKSARLEVVGFASSSGPEFADEKIRAELNLAAARQRAENVKTTLDNASSTDSTTNQRTDVKVKYWRDGETSSIAAYDKMKSKRRFSDRIKEQFDKEMGLLNRRVEIQLMDAGDCISTPSQ